MSDGVDPVETGLRGRFQRAASAAAFGRMKRKYWHVSGGGGGVRAREPLKGSRKGMEKGGFGRRRES